MMPSDLNWFGDKVKRLTQDAIDVMLDDLAHATLERAEANIQANDQIDTGFLRQTGYVESEISSTYSDTPTEEEWVSKRTGQIVSRKAGTAPPARGHDEAIVGFSAEYAIYPELELSFLWAAVEDAGDDFDLILKPNLDIFK